MTPEERAEKIRVWCDNILHRIGPRDPIIVLFINAIREAEEAARREEREAVYGACEKRWSAVEGRDDVFDRGQSNAYSVIMGTIRARETKEGG